jgi:hypothetical protein
VNHSTIFVGDNTHTVELDEVEDHDRTRQINATVTVTSVIDKSTGLPPAGLPGLPLAMPHVANGKYRAVVAAGVAFVAGRLYEVKFSAVGAQGFHGEWVELCIAKVRSD